jgi:DNA-binding transcriptional MerR regulator
MFRIGEFSKFTQVPGSALRYYDDIGLFKPTFIDQTTGYRYYSAAQIPQINRIVALKELGLNLEQIQKLMNEKLGIDEFKGMLALRQAEVNQKIEIEKNRLLQIEARISQIDSDYTEQGLEIITKSIPNQQFMSIREKLDNFDMAQQLMISIMTVAPTYIKKSAIGRLTAILHSECFDIENVDIELGIIVSGNVPTNIALADGREITLRQLNGHELIVSATRVGSPSSSFCCRSAIAKWIESNQYQLTAPSREVFIIPPMPGRVDQTVLEFQYPISTISS